MLKLPKSWEISELQQQALTLLLNTELNKFWEGGELMLRTLPLSKEIEQSLSFARRCGKLKGGLENIEVILQKEEAGLAKQRLKNVQEEKSDGVGQISRLLLVTNDGSERFYRKCESILKRHSHRLHCLKLDVSAKQFGEKFFGSEAMVKAALIDDKTFVGKVFIALAASTDS